MSDAWRFGKITDFEQVTVGPTTLLRIAGSPGQGSAAAGPRPVLMADDGVTVSHFAAIPAPADAEDVLRAAYSVPADKVTPATVFSLECEDGFVIALPDPVEGPARVKRPSPEPAPASAAPTPDAAAQPDLREERRGALHPKLTELSGQLAETRRANVELRAAAEEARAQAREVRERLLHLHLQSAETRAELQAVRELAALASASPPPEAADAQRVAELETAVADLQARASAAEAERDYARERVDAAESEAGRVTAQLAELETWSAELERRLGETTTELAEARARLQPADPATPAMGRESQVRADPNGALAAALRDAVDDAHAIAERDLNGAGDAGSG